MQGITYFPGIRSTAASGIGAQSVDFYHSYLSLIKRATEELAAMNEEMVSEYEKLNAMIVDMAGSTEIPQFPLLESRRESLSYLIEDVRAFSSITASVLLAHENVIEMIETLREGSFPDSYIAYRETELNDRSESLNRMFGKINTHYFTLLEAIRKEEANLKNLENLKKVQSEDEVVHHGLVENYMALLRGRKQINNDLEVDMLFVENVIKILREDLAKQHLNHLEEDTASRQQALQEQRYQTIVEDVRDYDGLEGQYRHHYDDEGNLIETEKGGDGKNKEALWVIAVSIVLVLVVGVAYFYFKQ